MAQTKPRPGPPNLRELRDEHVNSARERIFGLQGSMPGDRYFRKKLEGRQLMRWYFPSKYNLQDFRVDEYFEMQSERFAPRETHRCIPAMDVISQKVVSHREDLRKFFNQLDEETFLNSPSLQDLYGMFRLVDSDHALPFPVPESIFVEHSPMFGKAPVVHLTAGGTESSPTDHRSGMKTELKTLWALLKEKLKKGNPDGESLALALDARVSQLHSEEEIRTLLLETAHKHGIASPFEHFSIVLEEAAASSGESSSALSSDSSQSTYSSDMELRAELTDEDDSGSSQSTDTSGTTDEEDSDRAAAKVVDQVGETTSFAGKAARRRMSIYLARPEHGGSQKDRLMAQKRAEEELQSMRNEGAKPVRKYLERRHRFIDPMFRRRRLKWLERQMAGKNKETEVKFNTYYATHPDNHTEWPTNKGSVTVEWPSPHH